jgi:hypothetical protein
MAELKLTKFNAIETKANSKQEGMSGIILIIELFVL